MILMIVLIWIAYKLGAPWWIYVLIGWSEVGSFYHRWYVEKQINEVVEMIEEELR